MSTKFYENLRSTVDFIQNERELQNFTESVFKSNIQNILQEREQLIQSQKEFFSYAKILWESGNINDFDVKFPGVNTNKKGKTTEAYQLPDTHEFLYSLDQQKQNEFFDYLENGEKNDLLPLFLSPLAINFFYNSFHDIMQPYFMGQKEVPNEENYHSIYSALLLNLQQNLGYCPSYISDLLTKQNEYLASVNPNGVDSSNNENGFAIDIFNDFVLKILFKRPDLFAISCNVNLSLFNNLFEFLKDVNQGLGYPLIILLESNEANTKMLPPQDDDSAYDVSSRFNNDNFLNCFRQLLKICPRLPDKLPKDLERSSFIEIIEKLIVQKPGPLFFKRFKLYTKMEEEARKSPKQINQRVQTSLNSMKRQHDSEAFVRLMNSSKQLKQIEYLVSQPLSYYKLNCLPIVSKEQFQSRTPNDYIKSPKAFIDDIRKTEIVLKNIPTGLPNLFKPDNIYKNLIHGIMFNNFCHLRPNLKIADMSLETTLIDYNNDFLAESEDEQTVPLLVFMKKNFTRYKQLAENFVKAFLDSTDPLTKAKEIWDSYATILNAIKFEIGSDVENLKGKEYRTFVTSIFGLIKPPKIVSVYVFLSEFVFNSCYKQVFEAENDQITNEFYYVASLSKMMKTFFSSISKYNITTGLEDSNVVNYMYQSIALTQICRINLKLTVKYDEEELKKLAVFSDMRFSIGNVKYEDILTETSTKSRIEFLSIIKNTDHIAFSVYDNKERVYICSVSFSNENTSNPLPTDKNKLIEYLLKH